MDTTAGSKELGNAQDYLYPHNYPGNWVKQDYLPEKIRNHHYFQAEDTGKYERALAQRKEAIDRLRKSEILFKIALSSLDFFEKVVIYKHRNAVVYDFTLKC